jgi:glycosyltransferase involved in cell wall biosynthesis
MRVAVFYTGAYPIGDVTTQRVHNLCLGLAAGGVDVQVLLANPTEKPGSMRNRVPSGECDGVKFEYVGGSITRSERFWVRRLQDLYCHIRTILVAAFGRRRYDIALVVGPSLDFRVFLPFAGRVSGRKVVLEINEYPYVNQRSATLGAIKRQLLFRLVFPFYSGFVPISRHLSELVAEYKSPLASTITIPILAGAMSPDCDHSSPFDWPYIVHAGSLNEEKDGVLGILEAFAIVLRRIHTPLRLVITGKHEGTKQHHAVLAAIKAQELTERVLFVGYCSREKLSRILENSLLAIVNKLDTVQNRYCFATKLADYLLHGVPVITTTVGEARHFLHDGGNAYVVAPGRPELLAEKVVAAINNPEDRRRIGRAGRELAATAFSYRVQGARLARFLSGIKDS